MHRKLGAVVTVAAFVALSLSACGPVHDAVPAVGEELVVYSARSNTLNNAVIPAFEETTGIKIDLVTGGTGELLDRVTSERSEPRADVLWAADETMLASSTGLFERYVSPENDHMDPSFRNKTGYFTPAFADPTVLIVNTNLVGSKQITGYADLLDPALRGRIAFGDPASSSSAFQSLIAMLYGAGDGEDPMSDAAWDFVDAFLTNLDGKILDSSDQVYSGVATGQFVVGLTWENPAANLKRAGAPVAVVFPAEGAIVPSESVQIVKGAKHLASARRFVDYLLSEDVQERVGQTTTIRPLRHGVSLADYMMPTAQITRFGSYDDAWVARNQDEIERRFEALRP
jgi:iron(III) transport system substrate-binding protein